MNNCISAASAGDGANIPRDSGQATATGRTTPGATHREHYGAKLDPLALLQRRADVKIEFTRGELRERLSTILGESAFDEEDFREMTSKLYHGATARRERALLLWAWKRLDPLPPNTLKMIGHGMDHAVYVDPAKPGKVVKISVAAMSFLIKWERLFNRIGAATPERIIEQGKALARDEGRRYRRLASYFPANGSVPTQTTEIATVPVRRAAVEFLMRGAVVPNVQRTWPKIDDEVVEMPALMRTQDLLPQLDKPSVMHFSLSMRYPELMDDAPPPSLYGATNDSFILHRASSLGEEAFRYCLEGTKMQTLYKACLCDTPEGIATRAGVVDFLDCGIDFMNETREVLDVGGDGNVIFDEGRYFLPDALPTPDLENGLEIAAKTLRQLKAGESTSRSDLGALVFVLNQTRAINSMAQALGVAKRVHILPPEEALEPTDWAAILKAMRSTLPKTDDLPRSEPPTGPEPVLIPVAAETPWRTRIPPTSVESELRHRQSGRSD
jgi:hypothetical protein